MINVPNFSFKDTQWRPKVLVTSKYVPEVALEILREKCELIINESNTREEILEKAKGVDGIYWASHNKLDKEVLDAAGSQLKVLSTFSAGLDHIDLKEVKERNIPLGHTPRVLNDAVADLAVALALSAGRRLHEGRRKIENEKWEFRLDWMLGHEIRDSTVGIVGFGSIGQTIAKRLGGFEVKQFLYCGHNEKPEAGAFNARFVSFHELLETSDFVFITCPLTNETRGMFNHQAFSKMKSTSVLVNVARGGIVDQEALHKALKAEKIFAAGIDVMTPEPLPVNHPLLTLPNCVISPHLGSATIRARDDMGKVAAINLLAGLAGAPMISPAN